MFRQKSHTPPYLAPSAGPSAKTAPAPQPATRLFSVAALLHDGRFTGRFQARGGLYRFTYAPASAALRRRRLELTGRLEVTAPAGEVRSAPAVRARLLASQGSVADAPPRPGPAPAAADSKQPPAKAPAPRPARGSTLPITESTGAAGSAGVLFFEFAPLDGASLGVPLDLGRVQLNARLAPEGARDREIFWIWADLVAALVPGYPPGGAREALGRLNGALRG